MPPSILFLLPYPLRRAPSQRFRIEAWFDILQAAGHPFRVHTFLSESAWAVLYRKGSMLRKATAIVAGFLRRLAVVLLVAPRYQYIVVHREASPLGPPVFEWMLTKLFRKKLIYDFDDAIWIPNTTASNRLAASAKCFWKVKRICRWAHKVAVGNEFLAAYARQYAARTVVLPTCVDTHRRYNQVKSQESSLPVIGWTGSHSTLKYLDPIYPGLQALHTEQPFRFLVICNQPPAVSLPFLEFRPWTEATEIDDLLEINIGIMPLVHDAWSEGKCGFKLIQYLSLGIPAVASPVGVNKVIVDEGVNGYLCNTATEWADALRNLVADAALRQRMGATGVATVQRSYSLQANQSIFLSLFSD